MRGWSNGAVSRRIGVSTRVLVGVAVVVTVVSIATGQFAVARVRDIDRAHRLEERSELVVALTRLRAAMFTEEVTWGVLNTHQLLQAPDETLSRDVAAAASAGAITDRRLRAVPAYARPIEESDLERIRTTATLGLMWPSQVGERFRLLQDAVRAAVTASARVEQRLAVELRAAGIDAPSKSIAAISEIFDTAAQMTRDMMRVWFGSEIDQPLLRSRLAAGREHLRLQTADLLALASPSQKKRWERALEAPAFDLATDRIAMGGEGTPTTQKIRDADFDALQQGSARAVALGELIPRESKDVVARSQDALDEARSDATKAIGFAIAVVSFVTLGGVLFAISVVRPLRSLTAASARVVAGDLSQDPLPLSGPAEIVEATHAFNLSLANLRLIEMKTRALAEADLNAEVMNEPLPGMLGESLTRSVEVLSESLRTGEVLKQRLHYEATHDSLTGILNRAAAIEVLQCALTGAGDRFGTVAVIFVDLDNFGAVNDAFGHHGGDRVLKSVADRMSGAAGPSLSVSRLGGDEFLLVCEGIGGAEAALTIARNVLASVRAPIDLASGVICCGGSAGVALNEAADTTATILQRADLAVYRAKQSEPGSVHLFDDDLREEIAQRHDIELGLRSALANGDELYLVYQPVVDAVSNQPVAAEALLRWNRPGYGEVSPSVFIPVAECTSLINDIDQWVVESALGELAKWTHDPVTAQLKLAVNISGGHLVHAEFLGDVCEAIRASKADPRRLIVEVTETVLVMDLDLMAVRLDALHSLGITVAIDDYGTGFSSLAHVRELPIDELKIDQSFVRGATPGSDKIEIIRMICGLARLIGVDTVAEGVETEEDAAVVRAMGCTNLQGYYFSKPLRSEDFRRWMVEHADRPPPAPSLHHTSVEPFRSLRRKSTRYAL